MSWLVETLGWTAVLLALVLVLRRPVARQFGPQAAYALWALPFLRLLLPPIELPAWLAPADPAPARIAADVTYFVVDADPALAVPAEAAQTFEWVVLIPAVWLTGALLFLAWRFAAYFHFRRQLLADARPVGESGRVRLVETPEVASPLAFGVLDKVVALPLHFMANHDRRARDLALEHELAHHRGHDLLVNFAVQPLFALHWFNPLSWLGWRALRRDQEAACDARVIAARGTEERAAYASLIAGFAAGPRIALAAPMACPVLGDKSIVHRLRILTMTDISSRRRLAGRALVASAALALPLTASITYAEIPAAPTAPAAPMASSSALAPEPPEAPEAPLPPEAPEAGEKHKVVIVRRTGGEHGSHEFKKVVRDGEVLVFFSDGEELSEAEFEVKMDAHGERMEGLGEELALRLKVLPKIEGARFRVLEGRAGRMAGFAPQVLMSCEGEGATSETATSEGKRVIRICERRIRGSAVSGLHRARDQIAGNREMSETVRAEVLASLDREIARLEADK